MMNWFEFPLFHEIPSRRWWTVRIAALVWGLAAFLLAFPFLGGWALPGESAHALAVFSGADTLTGRGYPLLAALCEAALKVFSSAPPVLVLNTLGALFAAATAACLFPIVYFWSDDALDDESAVRHQVLLPFTAACFALLILVSSQGWLLASAHFVPGMWSALILTFAIRLLVSYARSGKAWKMAFFAAVYGAGMGESELVLLFAPVMVFLVITTEWRLWDRTTRHLSIWFVALTAAFLLSHTIRVLAMDAEFTVRFFGGSILRLLRVQAEGLKSFWIKSWILTAATGLVWALIAVQIARRALNNTRAWGHFALMAIASAAGCALFLNAPFTAWRLWLEEGSVPVLTLIIAAGAGGMLAAGWVALITLEAPAEALLDAEADDESLRAGKRNLLTRTAACVIAPVFCLTLLLAAGLGIRRAASEPVDFCDRLADSVLERLGNRRWFLVQGDFEKHLRLRAALQGRDLFVINPDRFRESAYLKEIRAAIANDPSIEELTRLNAFTLIPVNFRMFVEDFFLTQPDIAEKAAIFNLADVWYGARLIPRPEGFFFGGAASLESLKDLPLLADHQAFWSPWEAFFTRAAAPWEITRKQQEAMRQQAALVANNLGTELADLQRTEEAFAAYAFARRANPENVSALINLCDLVLRRGLHPEMTREIETDFERLIKHAKQGHYSFRGVTARHGHLRNSEALSALGWLWANVSPPQSVLAALRNADAGEREDPETAAVLGTIMAALYERGGEYELSEKGYREQLGRRGDNKAAVSGLTRLVIQRGALDEARNILNAGSAAGLTRDDLLLDWAMLYMASGKYAEAHANIERFLALNPDRPQAWALYGMILLAQKNHARVDTYVIPRLEKVAKGNDIYFVHLLRGNVAQASSTPEALANARAHYNRAYLIRPVVRQLLDMILQLDVALADTKNAELDALTILRTRPNHPYANFVIGSIRLSQGYWNSAAVSLQRCVDSSEKPLPAAYNNLAEALVRAGRFPEALAAARRFIELDPGHYAGWATLAVIQARMGADLPAARENLAKARALPGGGEDARLWLTDAWIAARAGDAAAMETAIENVLALDAGLTAGDLKEIDAIRQAAQPR